MRVVAGEAKGRALVAPPASVTRAATERIRESLFAVLEPLLAGARVLDLYAGAGTLGIEALSRGAEHATFVERDRGALSALRRNLASTGFAGRSTVVARDVGAFLGGAPAGPFDLVFCDPPFADVAGLSATLRSPGLRAGLAPGALVVARVLRKHLPAIPADAAVERTKEIGEEALLLLRYDAPRPS
ncbi:MAG: RsmD family RNA methyltransferase [Chloroflexota bacterium]|nr:RsmD family RNA methyltransferase [Chloroflexota bacterium]MDE3192227.1 RsmD family RNA methyltransferase [Chloroflexota bacterium]